MQKASSPLNTLESFHNRPLAIGRFPINVHEFRCVCVCVCACVCVCESVRVRACVRKIHNSISILVYQMTISLM